MLPPAYFFVIDVTVNAVRCGMLASAANAIKNSSDDLPDGDRTMVGFITCDTAVHYYALKPGMANPQMMVVGDLQELFVKNAVSARTSGTTRGIIIISIVLMINIEFSVGIMVRVRGVFSEVGSVIVMVGISSV
mmetsp:Transcript_16435/g.23990  ORF Transcript_16435/g.23990 Transcript_16435/m.23990 type:complete len:134 (-) Transcript_16435:221-622(-)